MVVYEVRFEPLERKWVVIRAGTLFSVHESRDGACAAAEEHAASESASESRSCRVVWPADQDGKGGERIFPAGSDVAR